MSSAGSMRGMWLGVGSVVVVGTLVTLGAAWLGWWAGGEDRWALIPGALSGGSAGYVIFGMGVPMAFTVVEAGSVRQAKRALRDAERDGRRIAVLKARMRLRLARWQRR